MQGQEGVCVCMGVCMRVYMYSGVCVCVCMYVYVCVFGGHERDPSLIFVIEG